MTTRILAAMLLLVSATPAAAIQPLGDATGLWMNPAHSVEIATRACGTALCGWVAWSDREADSDARAGGFAALDGTEILENYQRAGAATWHGRVLVPDMGRSFDSTLRLIGADRIKVSGCVLGGLLCKSQTWTRVKP